MEYTRRKEGRGEKNGMKADVSVSACSQSIKGKGKQRTVETEERRVGDDMSVVSERDGSRRLQRVTREMSKV